MLLTVMVVLVLGQPTSPPKRIIMEDTGIVGGFRYLIVRAHHKPWRYLGVGIMQLFLWVVIKFVFLLEMVKVVWVLGPPTLIPRNLIVVLMVKIFLSRNSEHSSMSHS